MCREDGGRRQREKSVGKEGWAMFGLVYDKAEWAVAALLVVAMVAAALA